MNATFTIHTDGPGLTEFTREVAAWLPPRDGLLTLFVRHTSASLLVQENHDPEVRADLQTYLAGLVPEGDHPSMRWLTHTYEGPDDMPAHIRAALLPVSLSIPVEAGRMALGTWQGLYLWEHRRSPHARTIAAHFG
ncbi:YjbQ family protein [Jannaschia sp. Os4]|uniref:secondary thiamine-phosphate synthase enzyme YjbQ n=1 Tax=Jannaschia sp. Os4 TaxID=2807617 RepID=UPI00193AA884|nr:YjbQ family protein [Jannaschia sp. Os4]